MSTKGIIGILAIGIGIVLCGNSLIEEALRRVEQQRLIKQPQFQRRY